MAHKQSWERFHRKTQWKRGSSPAKVGRENFTNQKQKPARRIRQINGRIHPTTSLTNKMKKLKNGKMEK